MRRLLALDALCISPRDVETYLNIARCLQMVPLGSCLRILVQCLGRRHIANVLLRQKRTVILAA